MTITARLRMVALLGTVLCAPLSAQPFTCTLSVGVPAPLRLEALGELLSDQVATCTGGSLGQPALYDITVFANVSLTNRILNGTTDGLLLIDDPAPAQQKLNTNVFQGALSNVNGIKFASVPITQPGSGTRVLRIVNLRGNVQQLGGQTSNSTPTLLVTFLQINGVSINNPQQTVGFVLPTTQFRLGTNVGSFADQRTLQVSFREDFASAFKIRVAPGGQQNIPGTAYFTESGFVNTAILPTAGLADNASRLMVQFSNVPFGANIYAPVFPDNNTNAQLVSTDANGAGPTSFIQGVSMFGGKFSQVAITNGAGIAVWEVTAANPFVIETLAFHLVFTGMTQAGVGSIAFAVALAPLSTVGTASSNAPLPRFANDAVAQFVHLTLTSNSNASSGNGPVTLPELRASKFGSTIQTQSTPQVQVGSTLSFTYGLINNGPGPAPNVMVQSNLPSTLSFLDCSTSTGGACSAATNPDGSITVTGVYPGSLPAGFSQYFIVHARPLNSALGTTVVVSALANSDKTQLDPNDDSLMTSFFVTRSAVTVPVSFPTNPAAFTVQLGPGAAQVNPLV